MQWLLFPFLLSNRLLLVGCNMISGAGLLQVQSYEKNCYQTVLSIVQIIHTFNASNMVVWTIGYFECEKTCWTVPLCFHWNCIKGERKWTVPLILVHSLLLLSLSPCDSVRSWKGTNQYLWSSVKSYLCYIIQAHPCLILFLFNIN